MLSKMSSHEHSNLKSFINQRGKMQLNIRLILVVIKYREAQELDVINVESKLLTKYNYFYLKKKKKGCKTIASCANNNLWKATALIKVQKVLEGCNCKNKNQFLRSQVPRLLAAGFYSLSFSLNNRIVGPRQWTVGPQGSTMVVLKDVGPLSNTASLIVGLIGTPFVGVQTPAVRVLRRWAPVQSQPSILG